MKSLKLLDNVQFIYELALAKLELQSLGTNFDTTNSLRHFNLRSSNGKNLRRRLAYFKEVNGSITDYQQIIQFNQTRSVNQYLTHWFYPYKGKFHPQMIRGLINIIGLKRGEMVLDPFIGSGTTALEAQLLGIDCIGIDVSPVCVLISKVKTESHEVLNQIKTIKDDIVKSSRTITLKNFDKRSKGLQRMVNEISNEKVKNFFTMAKLIAHSDKSRRRRDFATSFEYNIDKMISSIEDFIKVNKKLGLSLGKVDIKRGDSRKLKDVGIKGGDIQAIITSPPYSIALDYVKNDAHAIRALGLDTKEIRKEFIGVRGKSSERVDLYNEDMKRSLDEMYRVLGNGRYCVIVIGNATFKGKKIETVKMIIDYCKSIGFELEHNIDKIIFGLYNIMQKENILIFKKN